MNNKIKMLLKLRAAELSRNRLTNVSYQQLEKYLLANKWTLKRPDNISTVARDINNIDVNDLANFLIGSNKDIDEMFNKLKNDLNEEVK